MKKIVLTAVVIIAASGTMFAQKVKIDGEVRSRVEYRDGFKSPLADTLGSTTVSALRTRLNLNYADEKVSAKITLQDARAYGQTDTKTTGSSLGVFEAWGSYTFLPALSLKLGRQAIEYDDKRIFSASNWSNGNAHDLALLKFENDNLFKLHVGVAYNNESTDDTYDKPYTKTYKSMEYLWFGKKFGKFDFSALYVNEALEYDATSADKKAVRNTLGGNLALKQKNIPFSFLVTGYYQFGHDAKNKELNAYLAAVNMAYKFPKQWSISAGTDLYSGTATDETTKSTSFNKLYGTNHAFNGSMEYWTTPPTQGLLDFYGGVTFKANDKFDINSTFHAFSLVEEPATGEKSLGSEIDITANYVLSPQLALQAGYSAYFTTKQTEILKKTTNFNYGFPQWAYIMLTFKPNFLK
jgi:hypothetical protein